MKKFFKTFLMVMLLIPAMAVLAACTEEPPTTPEDGSISITSDMITLSQSNYVYNGYEHTPDVSITINGQVYDISNYATFENNINAGTATVTVTAPQNNEYGLTGSVTKQFTIARKQIKVNSLQQINNAIKEATSNHIITLTNDITSTVQNGYIQPVLICPENRPYDDITIDLNGNSIKTEIWIVKEYRENNGIVCGSGTLHSTSNTAKVNIFNSKETGIIGFNSTMYIGVDYSIILKVNNGFEINLNNVNCYGAEGGIYSNGNYEGNSIVNATDCSFTSTGAESIGSYLASNITHNFTNCDFTGKTAYYAKSGTHNLTNCNLNATEEQYLGHSFYGNGCNPNGSALVVDSSEGYKKTLLVNLYNTTFTTASDNAFDIDQCTTYNKTPIQSYSEVRIYVDSYTDASYVESISKITDSQRIFFVD